MKNALQNALEKQRLVRDVQRLHALTQITPMRWKLEKEASMFVTKMSRVAEREPQAGNRNAAKVGDHAVRIEWLLKSGRVGSQLGRAGEKERTGAEIRE